MPMALSHAHIDKDKDKHRAAKHNTICSGETVLLSNQLEDMKQERIMFIYSSWLYMQYSLHFIFKGIDTFKNAR